VRGTSGIPPTCDECRASLPEETRQSYRCPYAPIAPERLLPFVRPPAPAGYAEELADCPGYTTSLPETIEGARAWRHWEKADVRAFTGGGWPTKALTYAIETFDAAVSIHQRWCLDNPVKKD
jgi:hypothetical protein